MGGREGKEGRRGRWEEERERKEKEGSARRYTIRHNTVTCSDCIPLGTAQSHAETVYH